MSNAKTAVNVNRYGSGNKAYYLARYQDSNGVWRSKRIPVNITTQLDAEAWMVDWLHRLASAPVAPLNADVKVRKTLQSLYSTWIAHLVSINADRSLVKVYESMMKCWVLNQPIAELEIEAELSPRVCRDWIRTISAGLSANSCRNVVQIVRTWIDTARGEEWIDSGFQNPLRDVIVTKVLPLAETIAGQNVIIHLTGKQIIQLLNCNEIPHVRRIRYWLAFATGCRDSELAGLQWRDLDLEASTIKIDRQLRRLPDHLGDRFKAPKKNSHRTLPLHPSALAAVLDWLNDGYEAWCGKPASPRAPILPDESGDFWHPRSSLRLTSDMKTAGLPALYDDGNAKAAFTFHCFRRSFATALDAAGCEDKRIKALMGHKASGVTSKHYINQHLDSFRETIARLPL